VLDHHGDWKPVDLFYKIRSSGRAFLTCTYFDRSFPIDTFISRD